MQLRTAASAAALGLGLIFTSQSVFAAEGIAWAKSYEAAMTSAKKSHKIIMVDMYTDWCGWCKKLDKDTYPDAKVVKLSKDFVSVKVNAEKEGKDVAKKFHVSGYPTILFIDGNGALVGQVVGYQPPADFAVSMNKIKEDQKAFPKLKAHYNTHPSDNAVAVKLFNAYLGRNEIKNAENVLLQIEKNDPQNKSGELTKAYSTIADTYMNSREPDKAITYYNKVLTMSSNSNE